MTDKIYRRHTHSILAVDHAAKENEKNRKRNKILNFRVTSEEKELIETRIRLTGLSKEMYFIESCLYQKIFVKGNIKTFDAIRKSMESINTRLLELKYPEEPDKMTLLEIRTILELLDNIL